MPKRSCSSCNVKESERIVNETEIQIETEISNIIRQPEAQNVNILRKSISSLDGGK